MKLLIHITTRLLPVAALGLLAPQNGLAQAAVSYGIQAELNLATATYHYPTPATAPNEFFNYQKTAILAPAGGIVVRWQ